MTFRLNEQGRLEVTAIEPLSHEAIKFEVETASVMSQEQVAESIEKGRGIHVRARGARSA